MVCLCTILVQKEITPAVKMHFIVLTVIGECVCKVAVDVLGAGKLQGQINICVGCD